jgi:hypothetical protein
MYKDSIKIFAAKRHCERSEAIQNRTAKPPQPPALTHQTSPVMPAQAGIHDFCSFSSV